MNAEPGAHEIRQVSAADSWDILKQDPDTVLIDVRTQAEWSFVGVPDLTELGKSAVCVEWAGFPGMSKNPRFVEAVMEQIGASPKGPLFFLCRSGVRSMHAALAIHAHLRSLGVQAECVNVSDGFEGDLNADAHRGRQNGWQSGGLAWRQS